MAMGTRMKTGQALHTTMGLPASTSTITSTITITITSTSKALNPQPSTLNSQLSTLKAQPTIIGRTPRSGT